MDFGIRYLDYYVPDNVLPLNELMDEISDERIPMDFHSKKEYSAFCTKELRLKDIRVEPKLKDFEMLEILLNRLFDMEMKPKDIDAIIFAQERFNYMQENIAQYLQYEYKMNNAFIMNVSGSHCSNIELAMLMGKSILADNQNFHNVLIISVQKILEHSKRIIGKTALLGDGAGLLVLSRDKSNIQVKDISIINNGYFYDPTRNENNFLLQYKWAHKSLDSIFKRNNIKPDEIKKVIVQNINPYADESYLKKYDIHQERIFEENIGKYGHLTCIDFIINMKDFYEKKELAEGSLVISYSMGWAGSFVTSLFCFL